MFLAWIMGYYLTIFLLGQTLASAVFFILFFRLVGKGRWWVDVAVMVITVYFVFGIVANAFGLTWPAGIFEILEYPLPVPGFEMY